MPRLNLADGFRYFFSPIIFISYLFLYNGNSLNLPQERLVNVGVLAAIILAAGAIFYLLYRFFLYDSIILWLHDVFRRKNYRIYIQSQYAFPRSKYWPSSTRLARKIFVSVIDDHFNKPPRRIRAAGIHLLYQAGLLAIPFLILSILYKSQTEIALFGLIAFTFVCAAVGLDMQFEEEELMLLKRMDKRKLDSAARRFGIEKKAT